MSLLYIEAQLQLLMVLLLCQPSTPSFQSFVPTCCYEEIPLALQLLFCKHFYKDFSSWEHTIHTGTLRFTLSQMETFLIHVSNLSRSFGSFPVRDFGYTACWLHACDCSILIYLQNCKFIFSQKHFTFHGAWLHFTDSFTGVHFICGLQDASSPFLASAFPVVLPE